MRFPLVESLGEAALLVTFSSAIGLEHNRRARALDVALRESVLSGVVDAVPAYSSVLVYFEPEVLSEEDLRAHLSRLLGEEPRSEAAPGKLHEISVEYGGEAGPDLQALAEESGLTAGEVIHLHGEPAYDVYFLGFLPGFAYMGTVPEQIAAPRLASPRTRVPAGSVGIAGRQTGIYPFSSPGGWRLIGRTSLPLWDPARDSPALFAAGDRVRFVRSDHQPIANPPESRVPISAYPAFRVLRAGVLTTVQDPGRPGYGSTGLCRGGAMDEAAAARANVLVGNAPGAAVLELTWDGPELLALRTLAIAIGGADLGCTVEGHRVPPGLSWLVRAGSTIRFQPRGGAGNLRAYLAVAGGFDVPLVLGSRATYLPAWLGGYAGRQLREGDVLGVCATDVPPASLAGRRWPLPQEPAFASPFTLRMAPYAGINSAGAVEIERLIRRTWRVGAAADRMGLRLLTEPPAEPRHRLRELTSFGVVRGAVQLPPGGSPVILCADHQTTGGYPLLGVVAEADWPTLAQLRPGDEVRFVEISIEEARRARADARARLSQGARKL